MRTGDPIMLVGYAPRYFSAEFTQLIDLVDMQNVKVTVERINLGGPLQYRILCRISSSWPAKFQPCQIGAFESLAS